MHIDCPAKRSSQAQVLQDLLRGLPQDKYKLADVMRITRAEYEADRFYDSEEVVQSAVDLEMPKLLACCERRAAKLGPSGRRNLPASGRNRVMKAFFRSQDLWNACLRRNHWREDPKPPFNYPWCESRDHIPSAKYFVEWAREEEKEGKLFPSRKRKGDSSAAPKSSRRLLACYEPHIV